MSPPGHSSASLDSGRGAWRALHERGFAVVRAFIAPEGLAPLVEDFHSGPPPTQFPYAFKLISPRAIAALWPRLEPVLRQVGAETALKADLIWFLTFSHYITTEHADRTSFWHQDFDVDYRLSGDHLNYLNFYLPIVKQDPARSNVSVLPFDRLRARDPDAHRLFEGSGGHRLVGTGGQTDVFGSYGRVLDGENRPLRSLRFDVDTLGETPELQVGDLLVMRGDLIHRTQDVDTLRVAASIRVTHAKKTVKRERLEVSGPDTSEPTAKLDRTILQLFEREQTDELTMERIVTLLRAPHQRLVE